MLTVYTTVLYTVYCWQITLFAIRTRRKKKNTKHNRRWERGGEKRVRERKSEGRNTKIKNLHIKKLKNYNVGVRLKEKKT